MLLDVKNLAVGYGQVSVIRGIDFHVNKGEIVTILGANGAGKTTILRSLCGLIKSTEGTIEYEGKNITNLPPHKIVDHGISMVPEGRQLFPYLTVRDNLLLGAYRGEARQSWRDSLEEIYHIFPRLKERADQIGGSLSGGEQQMVAIGRGLMAKPSLLVFDEPSLGLSPLLVEQMFGVLESIATKRGVTVIIVEQNVFHTLNIADRGYILENGKVALTGSGKDLLNSPDVKKAYLGH